MIEASGGRPALTIRPFKRFIVPPKCLKTMLKSIFGILNFGSCTKLPRLD